MTPEFKELQRELKKRRSELEKLINQMKSDHINKGVIYRNLANELDSIDQKLETQGKKGN